MLKLEYKAIQANKKSPKCDVIKALDIYIKNVDESSMTSTNQILDYIYNPQNHKSEPRKMFFYLLYNVNGEVEGFAEFAYLPQNSVLVIDYISTINRSNIQFYCFYQMVKQEIEEMLKKNGQYVKYYVTELSLNQVDGKLIDYDSNFFRHMLSNENYIKLPFPYYQPPLEGNLKEVQEFSLALSLNSNNTTDAIFFKKDIYLKILKELYYSHYLDWFGNYCNREEYSAVLDRIYAKISNEISGDGKGIDLALVQCKLYEEGQCPKIPVESITLPRQKRKRRRKIATFSIWILFSASTFIVCVIPCLSKYTTIACSFLTILAGIISILTAKKDLFLS